MSKIIASLEYTMGDKVADKDICINDITAIERQDNLTVAVKFINGYTAFVPPKVAQEIAELWYKTAGDHVTISDEAKKPAEEKKKEE